MKSFKNIVLGIVAVAALNSCKKISPVPVGPIFPITVYIADVVPKYNMRMFVGNVEIKDTAKISKFFSTVPAKYTAASILTTFPQTYTFTAADSLQLASNANMQFNSANNKYVMSFTAHTTVNPVPAGFNPDQFSLYPSVVTSLTTGGYNQTRVVIVATGDYTDFSLSILNYKFHRPTPGNLNAVALISNELNPASITQLGATDTLAVQEFALHYRAKPSL